MSTPSTPWRINILVPIASAAALAVLGYSPAVHAGQPAPTGSAAPQAAAPLAPPTRAQLHLLHQMDPALHSHLGHHHGPHANPGGGECTCQSAPSGQSCPPSEAPEAQGATVNGTLTITVAGAVRTLVLHDLQHGPQALCFWPVGGSIQLTGADNMAHTAIFAPECGRVTLDGANLLLPGKHEFEHAHGPGEMRHKMGKQMPIAPPPSP